MPKWIQLDLFTGEAIETVLVEEKKAERITKTPRLALEVQVSIARLDPLTDTLKLVSELCKEITGITYPVNLNERRRSKQQRLQQQTEEKVDAEMQKPGKRKRGREQPEAHKQKIYGRYHKPDRKESLSARNASIRQRHEQGESQKDLAESTGLSPTTISNIINVKRSQP